MKLTRVKIEGFRSIKNVDLEVGDMLALVGGNNAGKSNIIEAILLCRQFDRSTTISEDFFYKDETSNAGEFAITLQFAMEDGDPDDLSLYNVNSSIQIYAKCSKGKKVEYQISAFCPKEDFLKYWTTPKQLEKYKNQELEAYNDTFHVADDVDRWREDAKQFIRRHLPEHSTCMDRDCIPIKHAIGASQLPHCIYIPPVKAIEDETKTTAKSGLLELLGTFLSSVPSNRGAIDQALGTIQENLDSGPVSDSEAAINRVLDYAFPGMKATLKVSVKEGLAGLLKKMDVTIKDGPVLTDISNMGTGIQRMLIFAILSAYATSIKTSPSRSKMFLIEEPEIYLHPHAQRSLYDKLVEIKTNGDQIIYSTHSNLFINVEHYPEIRVVRKHGGATTVHSSTHPPHQELRPKSFTTNLNEGFFADKIILTEGLSDELYFTMFLKLAEREALASKNISLLNCGGNKSVEPLVKIFEAFQIPCYPIMDRDDSLIDWAQKRFNADPETSQAFSNGAVLAKDIESVVHSVLNEDVLETLRKHKPLRGIPRTSIDCPSDFITWVKEHKVEFATRLIPLRKQINVPPVFNDIFKELGIKAESHRPSGGSRP